MFVSPRSEVQQNDFIGVRGLKRFHRMPCLYCMGMRMDGFV